MDTHATFRLPREARSVPSIRSVLDAMLRGAGWTHEQAEPLLLAMSEAATNAVLHAAGSATYDVEIEIARGRARVRVRDQGPGIDEVHLDMPGPEALRGRGLALIHTVTERASLRNVPGGGVEVVIEQSREVSRLRVRH